MKRKISIFRDGKIVEVEAEIVKIGLFSFGLIWELPQEIFDERKIIAYELKSGRIACTRSYSKARAPKQALLEDLHRLIENGEMEKALMAYERRANDRKKALQEEYEANIRKYQFPMNLVELKNS